MTAWTATNPAPPNARIAVAEASSFPFPPGQERERDLARGVKTALDRASTAAEQGK